MRFVDVPARKRRDQGVVSDLIAEPRDHGRDLGVEQRGRHGAEAQHEDLVVLPGGVEHLDHLWIREQPAERREVDPGRLRVHDGHVGGAGELDDTEFRPIGALTHELGVHRDVFLAPQTGAKLFEGVRRGDERGSREVRTGRTGHRPVLHRGGAAAEGTRGLRRGCPIRED